MTDTPDFNSFISEDNYQAELEAKVLTFWQKGVRGTFTGVDGIAICYRQFILPENRATVVVVPGTSETMLKYQEFVYELSRQGFSIFIYDHRGHGLSGRWLKDPEIVHVEKFQDYVIDLESLIARIIRPMIGGKLIIFGHSLGGAVACKLLIDKPDIVSAAVLNCPMFEPHTMGIPKWLVKLVLLLQFWRGKRAAYTISQRGADKNRKIESSGTRSRVRFDKYMRDLLSNPAILLQGGVSNGWVYESIKAGEYILKHADRVRANLLLVQAEIDTFIENRAHDIFYMRAPRCRKVFMKDTYHETWNDTDRNRVRALNYVLEFLRDNS